MLSRRIDATSIFKSLDWFTVILYLLMVTAGVISIYAASYDFDDASMLSFDEFSGKQVRWIALSFGIGFILLLIDTRIYEAYAYPLYIIIVILLFITPFLAPDIKGSRSWLVFGPMSLQPAEFAKFSTALALSKLFGTYGFALNAKLTNYVKAFAIILIPIALILLQKETGSALTFLALFFVLYREGMSGLILFSALYAVIIFVVAIKFTETAVMGIPVGEFWLLVGLMAVMVVMLLVNRWSSKRFVIARNVIGWFAGTGAILWILTNSLDIEIPGMIVRLSIIG
ncbi:MAG: rod shape-determining protein RodA, partial [Muribaculaceae bacterium]|nr:rod shape-determining protein RodA [Muribaculaceae bacterium]